MIKKPAVSIVIPVYNTEEFLPRCLKSVINQTFSDFEVLLINDGSTDNSLEVCLSYKSKDDRFKVFTKKNEGVAEARNYGIKRASAKYIVFIDSDDFIQKKYLEKLYNKISNSTYQVVMCGYYMTDQNGAPLNIFLSTRTTNIPKKEISGKEFLYYTSQKNGWANEGVWDKIYSKDLFKTVQFPKGKYYEDYWITPYLYWNIKKIAIIPEPLYYYVQQEKSFVHSKWDIKKFKDRDGYYLDRINFYISRDKLLAKITTKEYINWLFSIAGSKETTTMERKYIQGQLRKFTFSPHVRGLKQVFKEMLGIINVSWVTKLSKIIKRKEKS